MSSIKNIFLSALSLIPILGSAQETTEEAKTDTVVRNWTSKTIFGLNGSQSSFVNWAAGGRNNVSMLGFIDASIKYEKYDMKWTNDLKFALGGLRYIDSTGKADGLQKTDDRIDIASTYGLKFKEHWFYTATAGFKTQSLDGFAFPNDSVPISRWLAPAYINISIGIEYAPSAAFNLYVSPLAEDWLVEVIRHASEVYGLKAPIMRSELLSEPLR